MSDEILTLEQRRAARAGAQRRRQRGRISTLLLILAPMVLAVLYGQFVAAPRYASESRFTVRSLAAQSAPGGPPSLLNASSGAAGVGGFTDGWAVRDYLESRDAMLQLERKVGLAARLTYEGMDPLYRLGPGAKEEELYRAYRNAVSVSYNMLEQINVVAVQAPAPESVVVISDALLELAGDFVNRMDERGVRDALQVSKTAVDQAEQQSLDALAVLTAWRRQHGNIDPVSSSAMLLGMEGQLEGELSAARINLERIRALDNPAHPMLRPAQVQIGVLERRLQDVRKRLSGSDDAQASLLESFEKVKSMQTFAEANLAMARQNHQQAFTDALRMRRYVSVISLPIAEAREVSLALLLLQGLAAGLVLALLRGLIVTVVRGWRHA
ncbi:sugar ABC transporter [Achromobacter seleniivolatilans]|uniref:Sugar ABC transporter n=1 Tax=Achromobacter seleniivolatilans TaxID=3047478 RepID=A0ABY9M1D2_9BURK|nr:sugar ABC transporter [Achromobacter sp. R39]WMD20801.1 sugar ABC transporter [Achromobacter sp. R39]